jgi:hypothetical protein
MAHLPNASYVEQILRDVHSQLTPPFTRTDFDRHTRLDLVVGYDADVQRAWEMLVEAGETIGFPHTRGDRPTPDARLFARDKRVKVALPLTAFPRTRGDRPERYPLPLRWAIWLGFPIAVWALVYWVSIAHAEDATPWPSVYHQLRLDWWHQLREQPGGEAPGVPPDSMRGRLSSYA